VPLEATVSYGAGTRRGPGALIEASRQVELYDRELGGEPALQFGIHTLPPVPVEPGDLEATLARIESETAAILSAAKLPLILGGEHTVTIGAVRAAFRARGEGPLVVVQLDAHVDLRSSFEGTPYSHACAMRRILELPGVELLQVAVRSLSAEEAEFMAANAGRIRTFYADEIHADPAGRWLAELAGRLRGRRAYLTIDVDGLDPAVVPATGTPEPGGLTWQQAVKLVDAVCRSATVVALDCVELAPRPDLHAADFAVAKLLYRAISRAVR
jgi:agmatinase